MRASAFAVCIIAAGCSTNAFGSTPAGNLSVSHDSFTLPGFMCGDNGTNATDGTVQIFWPTNLTGTKPYPIVSLMHGSGGKVFQDWGYSISSLGIVVVAPTACGDWSQQQLHAIKGPQANTSLHPAFNNVDFSRVGLIGHSEGAAYTMGSAASGEMKISAMVVSHGASGNAAPKVPADLPSMYATGSADPRRRFVLSAFNTVPSHPKVLAELDGGRHMEPEGQGRLNEFDAHFLGCYLLPRQASCDLIYGNSADSLCKKHNMSACQIDK